MLKRCISASAQCELVWD